MIHFQARDLGDSSESGKPAAKRQRSLLFVLPLVFLHLGSLAVRAGDPTPLPGPLLEPPPPAPPEAVRKTVTTAASASQLTGLTLYSIGNPTDEEQLYVELINWARANPAGEGQRLRDTTDPDIVGAYDYFGVDLDQMASDMATLAPQPPLSIHPALTAAARGHSLDMLTNAFQGHTGSDGSNPGGRISAAGYAWSAYGENVYASAKSVHYGHAGFEVDWGYGPGGMQSPPGHRLNIHSSTMREIGVGVALGSNGNVGPQLVTQDLARRSGTGPFITGVVYYDFNGNGAYDLTEGLGGVTVTVEGSSYYAITADAGGYSVPAPSHTDTFVTFAATGLPDHQVAVSVAADNVKLDYLPTYAPPVVSGPPETWVGQATPHDFTPVGGATGYEWEQTRRIPYAGQEGAESGLGAMKPVTSPGYSAVTSETSASGTSSFHLAHPEANDQLLDWSRVFRLGTAGTLNFQSRLGWATSRQVARTLISADGGLTWQELWNQPGNGSGGQSQFGGVSLPLGAYAGEVVQFRFLYDFTSGSYYPQTENGVGWFVDDIAVTDAEELVSPAVNEVGGGGGVFGFDFAPSTEGSYALRVRARVGSRLLEWGPLYLTEAVPPGLMVEIDGIPSVAQGRATFYLDILSGAPGSLSVERAESPAGPWSPDPSATLEALTPGSRYRIEADAGSVPAAFFRVRSD